MDLDAGPALLGGYGQPDRSLRMQHSVRDDLADQQLGLIYQVGRAGTVEDLRHVPSNDGGAHRFRDQGEAPRFELAAAHKHQPMPEIQRCCCSRPAAGAPRAG